MRGTLIGEFSFSLGVIMGGIVVYFCMVLKHLNEEKLFEPED